MEAKGSRVQGHLSLHSEFSATVSEKKGQDWAQRIFIDKMCQQGDSLSEDIEMNEYTWARRREWLQMNGMERGLNSCSWTPELLLSGDHDKQCFTGYLCRHV